MISLNTLRELIESSRFASAFEVLKRHVALGYRITLDREGPVPVGTSRLGGEPDLPPSTEWPRAADRVPLGFLAQIRTSEVPLREKDPLRGDILLSFFYDLQRKPWGFPEDAGGFCVLRLSTSELEQRSPPAFDPKPHPAEDPPLIVLAKDISEAFAPPAGLCISLPVRRMTFQEELCLPPLDETWQPKFEAAFLDSLDPEERAVEERIQALRRAGDFAASDALAKDRPTVFKAHYDLERALARAQGLDETDRPCRFLGHPWMIQGSLVRRAESYQLEWRRGRDSEAQRTTLELLLELDGYQVPPVGTGLLAFFAPYRALSDPCERLDSWFQFQV